MSTTDTKRPLAQAMADAEAFRDLFADCYSRWEIAGSIRRGKSHVGDVEHVVVPLWGDVPVTGAGLFPQYQQVNLLMHRADQIVASGQASKHVYGTHATTFQPIYRWGMKYRGVDFRDFNNELFSADVDNWGSVLAIRTGSADFSRVLVTGLLRNGRRNHQGDVWDCEPCAVCVSGRFKGCTGCDGTGLAPVKRLSVSTEREFFELAGVRYRAPEERACSK